MAKHVEEITWKYAINIFVLMGVVKTTSTPKESTGVFGKNKTLF